MVIRRTRSASANHSTLSSLLIVGLDVDKSKTALELKKEIFAIYMANNTRDQDDCPANAFRARPTPVGGVDSRVSLMSQLVATQTAEVKDTDSGSLSFTKIEREVCVKASKILKQNTVNDFFLCATSWRPSTFR